MVVGNAKFSWRNYTRPTPENILGLAAALRRLVVIAAGTSIVMEAGKIVPLTILFLGWSLDELKNFASNVIEHEKESVTAHFPSGSEITVTQDTPDLDKVS